MQSRIFSQARRGLAALEFAIVLPILLTILLGATDFGRFSHSRIAIVNAARCGAAYASLNPYDSTNQTAWKAGVKEAVTDELSESAAFDPAELTVTTNVVFDSGGLRRISVKVSYPFKMLIDWPLLPATMDLQETVVMRGIR
jgi:Flp pilus assembly protein TadG